PGLLKQDADAQRQRTCAECWGRDVCSQEAPMVPGRRLGGVAGEAIAGAVEAGRGPILRRHRRLGRGRIRRGVHRGPDYLRGVLSGLDTVSEALSGLVRLLLFQRQNFAR
ncbi:unnamed protein product, partial [Ascophyllum nodosum]